MMYGSLTPLGSSNPGISASTCISKSTCSLSSSLKVFCKPSSSLTFSLISLIVETDPEDNSTSR